MGSPLQYMLSLLQGGPLSMLPQERSGVRSDYGLRGAVVTGSGLEDQLRNADFKQAAIPSPRLGAVAAIKEVLKKEPPVPPGMMRLYRGGPKGKWWSSSRDVAEEFAKEHALAAERFPVRPNLQFIDVLEETGKRALEHPRVLKSAIPGESAAYLPQSLTDPLVRALWMASIR